MRTVVFLSASIFLGLASAPAPAQDDRPNLSGTWQLDPAKCDLHSGKAGSATWVIDEKDNSIHIVENDGSKDRNVECSTDGKECSVTPDKAKASFWYNGPTLVEMETKGSNATRYRMKLSADGSVLNVEVTHIVPQSDKSDTLAFVKRQ
jgi:hypothetical protein